GHLATFSHERHNASRGGWPQQRDSVTAKERLLLPAHPMTWSSSGADLPTSSTPPTTSVYVVPACVTCWSAVRVLGQTLDPANTGPHDELKPRADNPGLGW